MPQLLLLLLAVSLPALLQAAGGRHALILCNQNYKTIGALRTPLAEAVEAEKTLATLGFEGNITVVTDASTVEMMEAVDTFAANLSQADVALFFYGGHAVQAAGENYLLGVDSDPATASQLAYKALPLGRVLTNLEGSGARLNLLILDCCRDNPLPARGRNIGGTRGLAALANAPKGTFIAYAADANQQAWDDHGSIGLYGSVLFEKMKTPGLRLEDIFIQTREQVAKIASQRYDHRQEPAEYSKVRGAFYFSSLQENQKPDMPAAKPNSIEASPANDSYSNSIGMRFVRVEGTNILFCIHEVRVKDFALYHRETGAAFSFREPLAEFDPSRPHGMGEDHPVVNISYNDATGFCEWLSKKDGRRHRVPTDAEWSHAVGIGALENEDLTPKEKRSRIPNLYPWGHYWPPPKAFGNYSDQSRNHSAPVAQIIADYWDGYPYTSPVMSFAPNKMGIFDLSGNVCEWCSDFYSFDSTTRVIRGGGWFNFGKDFLLSSSRTSNNPARRDLGWGIRCVVE